VIADTIDLHVHLLPGIDDGPRTEDDAVESARAAVRDGTTAIAATPHLRHDFPDVVPSELAARCGALQERLSAEGIELRLLVGGEVDLSWALEASDDDLRLCTYGQRGTDLLLETPYGPLPPRFEELLFDLQLKGYRLLLAHPERSRAFQADPGRLAALVSRGVLVQLTADSLGTLERRSGSAALARDLLRGERAHVLASDLHGAATAGRVPLSAAVKVAASVVGESQARWLVSDAPAAILDGRPLPRRPASAGGAGAFQRLRDWGAARRR
jgi:protein-tyrosine phosphatase